ncbi:hypothetical protein D3C76_1217330 [compost metagenome]
MGFRLGDHMIIGQPSEFPRRLGRLASNVDKQSLLRLDKRPRLHPDRFIVTEVVHFQLPMEFGNCGVSKDRQ